MKKLLNALSNDVYESIIKYNPDSIFILSLDGYIMKVNEAVTETFGYSEKELQRLSYKELTFPDDLQNVSELFNKLVQGTPTEIRTRAFHKNGSILKLHVKLIPLMDSEKAVGVFCVVKDRTEIDNTKESLRFAEGQIESIFNSTADAVEIIDVDWKVINVNPSFEKMYGWKREEVIGRVLPTIPQNRLEEAKSLFNRVRAGENITSYQGTCVTKNGKTIEISLTMSPIYNSRGEVVGISGISRDVTKQTQLEKSLKESEERYRTVVEMSPKGIVIHRDGTIMYANPYALKMANEENLIGQSVFDYIQPKNLEHLKERTAEAKDGKKLSYIQIQVVRKDGRVLEVELAGVSIDLEDGPAIMVLLEDITERKKIERDLRESLKKLADVNRALDDSSIIAITDHEGKINYVNNQFCNISKYSSDEIIGQNHRILNSGFHSKKFFKDMWKTIESGETWQGEIKNKAKDGSYYWVHTTIVPFLDEEGKPYQFVSIRNDVTERKMAEEALRESEERYRKVVDTSPFGIVVHQDGEIVFANETAMKTMEYENPIGESVFSFIHENYQEISKRRVSEAKLGGELPFEEMKLIKEDGSYIDTIVGGISLIYEGRPSILTMFKDNTDSKRIERELRESEDRYERLVDISPEAIIIHVNGVIRYANPACVELLGASSIDELMNRSILDFSHPSYLELVKNRVDSLNGIGLKVGPSEEKIISLDGKILDVEVKGVTLKHEDHQGFLMIVQDITRRKKAEESLRESEEMYRLIAENMTDLIRHVDANGTVHYASPSHKNVLGFSPKVFEGQDVFELVHPDDLQDVRNQFKKMSSAKENHTAEFRIKHAKGHWIWVEAYAKAVVDDQGEFQYFQITARNTTERKLLEEKLSNMAFYDPLTNIPNRRFFQEVLKQTLKEAERNNGQFSVMIMDMDKFKQINDSLGHDAGDELLKQFSNRVKGCLRESDTIARLGGDEFTILLPNIENKQSVVKIAKRILESTQQPWVIGEHEIQVTTSIGVAIYPKDGTSVNQLMKNADNALYEVKAAGRDSIMIYS